MAEAADEVPEPPLAWLHDGSDGSTGRRTPREGSTVL